LLTRLLCADDARADVRGKAGIDVRHHGLKISTGDHTTDRAAGLSYSRFVASPKAFTAHALDLAGICSPLLALLGGWFLWWWSAK